MQQKHIYSVMIKEDFAISNSMKYVLGSGAVYGGAQNIRIFCFERSHKSSSRYSGGTSYDFML